VWAPNGRELFFRQGDQLLAVDVDTRTGFSAGRPRLVLSGVYAASDGRQDVDVSPDGQTFLMLQPTNESERAPRRINVVVNWFSELQRLVPTRFYP
jgi:hypothetical protein